MNKTVLYFPKTITRAFDLIKKAPLTLITAGSSFGKTTAISHYLQKNSSDAIFRYYTCFGGSPRQNWSDICLLFSVLDEKLPGKLLNLELPSKDNLGYLSILANEFSCEKETFLIIDNYHLTGFPVSFQVLDALAGHHCSSLHLIFVTEPMAQTEFSGITNPLIYRIDQDAFLFQPEDILQLFKKNHISIDLDEALHLFALTEGWIAPLQLYMIQYQSGADTDWQSLSFDQQIGRYFWEPLTAAERSFYMVLSLLDTFEKSQALLIAGDSDLMSHLWSSVCSNALIHTDRHAYTMHNLLKTYLQERFYSSSAEFQREGLLRVGHALRSQKKYLEAFLSYARAGADADALALPLTSFHLAELVRNHSREVEELIANSLPHVIAHHWYFLLSISVKASLMRKASLAYLGKQKLNQLLSIADSSDSIGAYRPYIHASLELIASFQSYNDIAEMSRHHRAAFDYLDQPDDFYLTNDPWTFCIPSPVYMFWRNSGQLQNTCQLLAEKIPVYSQLAGGKGAGSAEAMEAEISLLAGDLQEAKLAAYKAHYKAVQFGQDSLAFCADLTLCRIAILEKDVPAFQNHFQAILDRGLQGTEFFSLTMSEVCKGFLYCVLSMDDHVPDWLRHSNSIREHLSPVAVPYAAMLMGHLLSREMPLQFLGIASELTSMAEQVHSLLPHIYCLLAQADASVRLNQSVQGRQYLLDALRLATPDQVCLPFAEYFAPLSDLFKNLPDFLPDDDPVSALLTRITRMGKQMAVGTTLIRSKLCARVSPLTLREREIALLARRRFSNQEIANQLSISPVTVKNTLYKIYEKLDISGRKDLEHLDL